LTLQGVLRITEQCTEGWIGVLDAVPRIGNDHRFGGLAQGLAEDAPLPFYRQIFRDVDENMHPPRRRSIQAIYREAAGHECLARFCRELIDMLVYGALQHGLT